ncbi:MAG: cbs rane protein [Frankiales bacterium]|nr:cbs rane protein [Frankiales bacterium]
MEQTVQDVMTHEVATLPPWAGYRDAVRVVEERHVDALPVIDDDRRVVGVVTVGDLLLKQEASDGPFGALWRRRRSGRRAAALTVAQCMSRAVTVAPTATLCAASRLMHKHRVGGLAVVDAAGRLSGIVTRSDLLKVFLHADDEVCATVQQALGRAARDITCEVTDGRVRLDGHVQLRSDADRAVATVRRLPAVVGVDSHVRYEVDDVESMAGA